MPILALMALAGVVVFALTKKSSAAPAASAPTATTPATSAPGTFPPVPVAPFLPNSAWVAVPATGPLALGNNVYYYMIGQLPTRFQADPSGLQQYLMNGGWQVTNLYLPGQPVPVAATPLVDMQGAGRSRSDNGAPIASSPFNANTVVPPGTYQAAGWWAGPPGGQADPSIVQLYMQPLGA